MAKMHSVLLPRIATVLLAVLLVISVTEWVLRFSARRTPREPVVVLPAADLDSRVQLVDMAPVARLFGAADAAEAGPIRALGVMAERGTGRGIAILDVNGQRPRAYRVGDAIAPGVELKEVKKDGVVISRAGALQQLAIPKKSAAASSDAEAVRRRRNP